MKRKLLLGLFILTSLLIVSPKSYAGNTVKELPVKKIEEAKVRTSKSQDIEKNKEELKEIYQLINPEKTAFTTEDKFALLNGKASKKSLVTIKLYGTMDMSKKAFNLDKLPSEEDYIEILEEDIEVGNLGVFQKKLDLVLGINKIIVDFNVEGLEPYELIIFVVEKAPTINELNILPN